MSKIADFIKPAGEDTEVITFTGPALRKPTWCKRCGRKHPKNEICDLVEYEQGEEYAEGKRHPGKHVHRSIYEMREAEKNGK